MTGNYRKDIDGLRAVAVLPVVLYHAGLGFPGGFVGVDVFFVISGYLITTLLVDDLAAGRFSFWRFYERRARRILPALLTVICASGIAAWVMFMPPDLVLFGRSATAATLFYANFLFRHEAGYFDAAAAVKPLLHTWSLAVEEQFYVLFPALMYLLFRHRRWLPAGVAVLTLASFGVALWSVQHRPVDAFYLLPSRFWELGLGAGLALLPQAIPASARLASGTVAAGLALIATAVFAFNTATPFPGFAALLPCIGAGLVIFGGRAINPLSNLLGAAPFRGVGLISYSLYLWHWPLIVFVQYWRGHLLTSLEASLLVIAAIGLATLSWAVIEQPVRHRRILPGSWPLWRSAVSLMLLFTLIGTVIVRHHGYPERLSPAVGGIYAAKADTSRYGGTACFTDSDLAGPDDADVRAGRLCSLGKSEAASVSFLVWGDSHAGTMSPGISLSAARFNLRGLLAGEGGCPPLLDYQNTHPSQARRDACVARNQAVLDLIASRHIPLVIMVARWPREVLGAGYGAEGRYFDPTAPYKTEDRSAIVGSALDRTLAALAALHAKAVLVMDVPEIGYDVPYTLAKAAEAGRVIDVNPPRAVVRERQRLARALLEAATQKYGAGMIDPTAHFCDATICHGEIGGHSLYTDSDHITRTTSERLSDLFDSAFAGLASPAATIQSSVAMPGKPLSQ